jgi:NADH:ubiquinone oxidoreductase subunit 3 (subunit A)
MKNTQSGFVMILLILGIALIGLIAGLYFTKGKDEEKSQYEQGQEAIEQAREINQQGIERSMQIKEQLDIQNDINSIQ